MSIGCTFDSGVIIAVSPGITYSDSLAGFESDRYRFSVIRSEIVHFYIDLFDYEIGDQIELFLYKFQDGDYVEVGYSLLTQQSNIFSYDAVENEFFFCIKSRFPLRYDLRLEFTTFPFVPIAEPIGYDGVYSELELTVPEIVTCAKPIYYKIIKGGLPPGLFFDSNGVISGIPEELDLTSTIDEPPSFVWHFSLEQGETSYAKVYPILVEAYFADAKWVKNTQWYYCCVYNNWDLDRKWFMKSLDNFYVALNECIERIEEEENG